MSDEIDRTNAEDCPACNTEDATGPCLYHEGVAVGFDLALNLVGKEVERLRTADE